MIEFIGGLLPVFGDAFDAVYKANTRNTALLRNYINKQLGEEPQWSFPWTAFFLFCLVMVSILVLIFWLS